MRVYVRRILGRAGFSVLEAGDGEEASAQIERPHSGIDLLITDIRMPRMDGVELVRRVHQQHPGIPVVFISGYPFELEEQKRQQPRLVCAFLAKPFTPKALHETVRNCLASRTPVSGAATP